MSKKAMDTVKSIQARLRERRKELLQLKKNICNSTEYNAYDAELRAIAKFQRTMREVLKCVEETRALLKEKIGP